MRYALTKKSCQGKSHQTIFRFLLKGFASRVDGDEAFTWVYRKNSKPFEANTKNINVERLYCMNS
ncbi:MAG: hypothetical protein NVSMB56_06650 [Pyrinomonadaceae bacterium]